MLSLFLKNLKNGSIFGRGRDSMSNEVLAGVMDVTIKLIIVPAEIVLTTLRDSMKGILALPGVIARVGVETAAGVALLTLCPTATVVAFLIFELLFNPVAAVVATVRGRDNTQEVRGVEINRRVAEIVAASRERNNRPVQQARAVAIDTTVTEANDIENTDISSSVTAEIPEACMEVVVWSDLPPPYTPSLSVVEASNSTIVVVPIVDYAMECPRYFS